MGAFGCLVAVTSLGLLSMKSSSTPVHRRLPGSIPVGWEAHLPPALTVEAQEEWLGEIRKQIDAKEKAIGRLEKSIKGQTGDAKLATRAKLEDHECALDYWKAEQIASLERVIATLEKSPRRTDTWDEFISVAEYREMLAEKKAEMEQYERDTSFYVG